MKKIITLCLSFYVFLALVIYIGLAFLFSSFDVANFNYTTKAFSFFVWIIICGLVTILIYDNKNL